MSTWGGSTGCDPGMCLVLGITFSVIGVKGKQRHDILSFRRDHDVGGRRIALVCTKCDIHDGKEVHLGAARRVRGVVEVVVKGRRGRSV